jgi:glycosyltransferase involved in cell wall biosynthesis
MKIAFILSNPVLSPTNGIVSQAKTWQKGLEGLGHKVFLIEMWRTNDWKSFDVIHFFGFSIYMRDLINSLVKVNTNIVVSPILDPDYSINKLKLYTHWGNTRIGLSNPYHALSSVTSKIKLFFARSEFEKEYLVKGFGIKVDQCIVVPLSFDISFPIKPTIKEPFCLHISLLMDERKNVKRLIQAAIKYKFNLILGGKIHSENDLKTLYSWIGTNNNIEYRGFLSTEEMMSLYSRAKVFALPSINEGVGIVALEAAAMGCDIVITNVGGPKEYYKGMANIIDPYNVDEIGKGIMDLIYGKTYQPQLKNYIKNEYSILKITQNLIEAYNIITNR